MTANPPPPPAAAPAPAPEAAKPAAKPKGIVRWGVLIVLVVLLLVVGFVGAGPVAKWAIEKYGSAAVGSPMTVESSGWSPLAMSLTLRGLKIQDPADPAKNQFEAEEVRAKVDPIASLKGQLVISEAVVVKPRGRIVRNADGSINGKQPEEPPPGTDPNDPEWKRKAEEWAKKRDLVEDFKKIVEKIKERREAKKQAEEEARRRREAQGVKDYEGRAEYVRGPRPLVVVKVLRGEGLELVLEDRAAGAQPQSLTEATLELRDWSTAPQHHTEPMLVKLDGKVGGAPNSSVKVEGKLDVTGEATLSRLATDLVNLPLDALDPYFRDTIPVKFVGTSLASLNLPLEFQGWNIDWKPSILLAQIQALAREPGSKIAGFESSKVAQELTNAGTLILKDIRVHGPIWAPKVEGDVETVKQLVLQGGKNYAMKTLNTQLDAQTKKLIEKNPELQKVLDQTPAGEILKGGTEGVGEAAKGALDRGFDLFGGKKKEEPKK